MQANANLCFMHMLTITFPALGLHEWYLSHISLNEDAQLSSEAGSSFKVYLHMPPHFNLCLLIVVAVLSLSRNGLASSNTSLASMCKKAYYKFSTYFWAFSKGPGQLAAHMRSLVRAFAQRVKVSIANTLNACVKLS